MKKTIHPKYDYVVFKDTGSDFAILTKSTVTTEKTIKWEDGNTYPLINIEISSKSHPFYTGKQRIVDTENRVKSFEKKVKNTDKDANIKKKAKRLARRSKVKEIKAGQKITLRDMLKDLQ